MGQPPKHPNYALLGFLVACFGIGFVGFEGALQGLGGWYLTVQRPTWALPVGLFLPLSTPAFWSAAGAGLLLRNGEKKASAPLALFLIQIAIQASWYWLLFAWHLLLPALVAVALAWGLGLAVMVLMLRNRGAAGLLMLPYLAWIAYCAALNFEVLRLNPPQRSNVVSGAN